MDKEERLKESNTFNQKSDIINATEFQNNELMDPRDLLQVRYELVRAIEYENRPVSDVCSKYGVSASTARRYVREMRDGGLIALVPDRKGPAGPTKLSSQAREFIDAYAKENPRASGGKVHAALEGSLHLGLSKRTVERYLAKK